jgi:hypothetical protein
MKKPSARPLIGALFLAIVMCGLSALSSAAVLVSVNIAPPPLVVYEQPPAPAAGYIWTPGYWAYGDDGYYWVPGTWVPAPFVGALWTPGYWGWRDDAFVWNDGYWGPHVGFYGGIDYGFGYIGVGYLGGRWDHNTFVYNTAVNNINTTIIHNTYSEAVAPNANASRVSFNGGNGGITAQPTAQERVAERDRHRSATAAQVQHQQAAKSNRAQFASANQGTPAVAATAKPLTSKGPGAVGTTQSARSASVAHRSPTTSTAAKTAATKTATTKEHRTGGPQGPGTSHVASRPPTATAAAKPQATKENNTARIEKPANAHVANRTPTATTTAKTATSKAAPVQEHHAIGTGGSGSANIASHHAPPAKQQTMTETREPARSATSASAPTHSASNTHVATAHAGNGTPPPSGGSPPAQKESHAQGPAPGGHESDERK